MLSGLEMGIEDFLVFDEQREGEENKKGMCGRVEEEYLSKKREAEVEVPKYYAVGT